MEKDPVVQEIPVFLSHALSDNLFIHQYPSRPANRELKELNVINAAVKPKNRLFRIEVGLDTFSEKYSDSKGEEIAINTDGDPDSSRNSKDKNRERHFRSGVMDKIVYESTEPAPGIHHYALGILQDKELHCTPIKGIFNMNQVYTHLDKQDKNKKEKNKNESDDEAEDVEPEVQQVTVKFARQETEVAKKAREKSYEALTQRIASEPWHDSMWKHSDTDHADLERLKLFCGNTSDDTALPLTPAEYLRALCPPAPAPAGEPGPPNKHSLQDMIKDILLSARVLTYRGVRRALPRDARGEPALLSALGGAACCVRGVWTARSADLYARGAGRLPGAAMCAARDHVLYLLNHHPYVIREKVAAAVRLPPDEVLSILTSVAKYNPSTGWELLLPPDTEFEAKYPDVVQRQNLYLEALERQFNEMTVEESPPKRQRKKSQRDSDSMMSPKARCNSVSDEDDKKRHKSKSGTGKRTRNVSSSSAHEAT